MTFFELISKRSFIDFLRLNGAIIPTTLQIYGSCRYLFLRFLIENNWNKTIDFIFWFYWWVNPADSKTKIQKMNHLPLSLSEISVSPSNSKSRESSESARSSRKENSSKTSNGKRRTLWFSKSTDPCLTKTISGTNSKETSYQSRPKFRKARDKKEVLRGKCKSWDGKCSSCWETFKRRLYSVATSVVSTTENAEDGEVFLPINFNKLIYQIYLPLLPSRHLYHIIQFPTIKYSTK